LKKLGEILYLNHETVIDCSAAVRQQPKTGNYSKMDLQSFLTTARLLIKPLTMIDDNFILELVNTEGWIKFIGDRNIKSKVEAGEYIQKILENKNISYWVVKLKDNENKIGIVTYIKRDYLEHPDIGFAFLPNFCKKGSAYEATNAVLNQIIREGNVSHIFATTVPENIRSIKLLKRIGFAFEKEIEVEKEKLHVYGASTDELIT
jgi:ribosomal-protein-alanine N-acetyltransferase